MKNKVLGVLFIAGLLVMILAAAVPMSVYDKVFFISEAVDNDVSENTGMSVDEISQVTDEIFLYLKGERKDFDIVIQREGKTIHLFNDDEQRHMVDVQNLMVFSRVLLILSTTVTLICGTLLYRKSSRSFCKGLLMTGITGIVLLIIAVVIASGDFTAVFIKLHQMIFSNELWLMDPATEILINIVPEPYFIHLAVYAGGLAAFGYGMSILAGLIGKKY